jgi:hypothetical protein
MSEVTRLLSAVEEGDPQAAEQLLPLVYDELRKLAAAKLAIEKPGQTLQPTALVHEAYLRLVEALCLGPTVQLLAEPKRLQMKHHKEMIVRQHHRSALQCLQSPFAPRKIAHPCFRRDRADHRYRPSNALKDFR